MSSIYEYQCVYDYNLLCLYMCIYVHMYKLYMCVQMYNCVFLYLLLIFFFSNQFIINYPKFTQTFMCKYLFLWFVYYSFLFCLIWTHSNILRCVALKCMYFICFLCNSCAKNVKDVQSTDANFFLRSTV